MLYDALGWEPPQFAHVPLLVDSRRQKLSKRDKGADMAWYRDRNVLPTALLNFAVLLGWSGGAGVASKRDVMDLDEMKSVVRFSPGRLR